jgi:hypothetical protein
MYIWPECIVVGNHLKKRMAFFEWQT